MHIRVYGVQADEMSAYEEAKVRYGFTFEFEAVPLSEKNAGDVKDCDALILLTNCIVNEPVAKVLASAGVKYLACRSAGSDHVDYSAVVRYGMKCCHVPAYAPEAISEHTIMLALEVLRHAKSSYQKVASGDFTLKGLKGRQRCYSGRAGDRAHWPCHNVPAERLRDKGVRVGSLPQC